MTTPATALSDQLASGSLAGDWTLDPARSTATLKTKSIWGLVQVKGVFGELAGGGTVSPSGEVTGRLALKTATLDTKNAKRDNHLRSKDFFLAEEYPEITFTLDKIAPAGEGVTVSGTLTVRDQTRPISFPAAVSLAGDGEVALDATVEVDRSEFGVTFNQLGMMAMKNTVTIHAVFTRG